MWRNSLLIDFGSLQVEIGDVAIGVLFILASEWCLPSQELVGKDAYSPDINLIVVGLLIDELRCHIVHCAAKGHPPLVDGVCGPSKVTQLHVHPFKVHDEDVLRFDVAMDDVPLLHVNECTHNLSDDVSRLLFRKILVLLQSLVEVAVVRVFKDHIHVLLIVEVAIEPDNVRMPQPPLNLQLFLHLRKEVELLKQVLLDKLECNLFVRVSLNRSVNLSKFTIPD